MRLPRLTVRRLMIAVAVVGAYVGVEIRVRRDTLQRKADIARVYLRAMGDSLTPAERTEAEKIIADSERPIRFPWLPVPPDPPPPQ